MDDRELLELAAKAAGILLKPMTVKPLPHEEGDGFIGFMTDVKQWPRGWFDPLTDDGDALRLAVQLDMQIWRNPGGTVSGMPPSGDFWHRLSEPLKPDPYAATRRAIVRAAAEIGESM